LSERLLHCSDFLSLIDDDFLSDPPQLLVVPVAQFRPGHVDRTLMMRHPGRNEIGVDVARTAFEVGYDAARERRKVARWAASSAAEAAGLVRLAVSDVVGGPVRRRR